jgi:hypothetical protein
VWLACVEVDSLVTDEVPFATITGVPPLTVADGDRYACEAVTTALEGDVVHTPDTVHSAS